MCVVARATPMTKETKREGLTISYRPNTVDEKVIYEQFNRNIFFSDVPEYRPHRDDVVIDVGAHIGVFAILVASKIQKGRVHAVEASMDNFNLLRMNIEANHLRNVYPHHLALSGRRGTARLFHDYHGNWGYTIMKETSQEYEVVTADSLGNFMSENRILKCDFMKLNCEGAEFPIILGAPEETLKRVRVLLILYHLDLVAGQSETNLVNKLERCGFVTKLRNRTDKRGWIVGLNGAFKMRPDERLQTYIYQCRKFMRRSKSIANSLLITFFSLSSSLRNACQNDTESNERQ